MNPKIHRAITESFGGLTAKEINEGNCFNWAWIANTIYPESVLCSVTGYGGHAFIELNGKYYDSENPIGVNHWSKLKGLRDNFKEGRPYESEMMEQTRDAFAVLWKKWGIHPMNPRALNKVAKSLQKQMTKQ